MNCKICNHELESAFRHTVLEKYDVNYFFCKNCGFLQTEEPHWLAEAYSSAIADADTGIVSRNVNYSRVIADLLYFFFSKEGKYLDVAGGYGLLTRILRDIGFDCYWSDPYCENRFAKGFSADETSPPFAAITAIEVFEHLADPVAFLRETLERTGTDTVIFSTQLFEGRVPSIDWQYYSFETGQHISFFQRRTLEQLAKMFGMNLYSRSVVHVLTKKRLNRTVFRLLANFRLSPFFFGYVRKRMQSKTQSDYRAMLGRNRSS